MSEAPAAPITPPELLEAKEEEAKEEMDEEFDQAGPEDDVYEEEQPVEEEEPVEEEPFEEEPVEGETVEEEEAVEEETVEEEAVKEEPVDKKPVVEKKAGAVLRGAQIFKELKKIIPTVDEADYKTNGVWQDEIMKLDAELLQRHLEEAGTARVETDLPPYKAPPAEVWNQLSKPAALQGNLASALAKATALAQSRPGLAVSAGARPTLLQQGQRPSATGLLSRLSTPRPALRIHSAPSASSTPWRASTLPVAGRPGPVQLGVKRTAGMAGLGPGVGNGALKRPLLAGAVGRGTTMAAAQRPISSVTGLAQRLGGAYAAAGKGMSRGIPMRPLGNMRPVLRRP